MYTVGGKPIVCRSYRRELPFCSRNDKPISRIAMDRRQQCRIQGNNVVKGEHVQVMVGDYLFPPLGCWNWQVKLTGPVFPGNLKGADGRYRNNRLGVDAVPRVHRQPIASLDQP